MIGITVAMFALVFLRAWQQQNVIHGWYWWAAATSYGIALADVLFVSGVVRDGLAIVPWAGTGGALGVTAAMWLRRHTREDKKDEN